MTEKVKLQLPTIITLVCILAGIIASHFTAIANGKAYTDSKVEGLASDIKTDLNTFRDHQQQQQIDIAVIKNILIRQYGKPKHD